MLNRILVFAGGLILASFYLFEPEFQEFENPEDEISRIVDNEIVPSVSAFVVKDGQIVWQHSFGYADPRDDTEAGPNTIYGIASVSKLVVVTAVMQQVERGNLNLDVDINTYLPYSIRNPRFPDDVITTRHLLTHTSGLSWPLTEDDLEEFYHYYPDDTAPQLDEWIPEAVIPGGSLYKERIWKTTPPGERYLYSNIGVSILGLIVQEITGTNFKTYCRQNIFLPLGMTDTSYLWADLDIDRRAVPFGFSRAPLHWYSQMTYPGANVRTTSNDFALFMTMCLNKGQYPGGRILEEETFDQILEMQDPASGVCLIWNRTFDDWYGHAGGQDGVSAYAEIHPESGVATFIVSNAHFSEVYPGFRIHGLVRQAARRYQ